MTDEIPSFYFFPEAGLGTILTSELFLCKSIVNKFVFILVLLA